MSYSRLGVQTLLIWIGLVAAAGVLALARRRRPLVDAWPAYVFALPLAIRITALSQSAFSGAASSVHDASLLIQEIAYVAFVALMVALFAVRSPVSGQHASRTQAAVAILGTFIVSAVGFLPVQPSSATLNLLISSVFLLAGTAFASWSLATLGGCFGVFPEVRGLVLRGPYRWIRHPVYAGEIISALGIVAVKPHPLTIGLVLTFVGLQYWRTLFEERALISAFPIEYPAYRAGVPRLIPGFSYKSL
jgi:protein-S-isoprenylcysteine O-methyltransferase Ste14